MPPLIGCPDLARYQQLAAGKLAGPDAEALLAHLQRCEACARKLQGPGAPEALAGLVRQARASQGQRGGKVPPGETPSLGEEKTPAPRRTVPCPACGKGVKVPPGLAGSRVTCPHCRQAMRLPRASAASPDRGKVTASYRPAGDREVYDFLAPPQAPDEIGRLGPYRVLRVLGAGGMGVVFRAEDPQLARPVALKTMLPALAASDSARQRFLREARAAAGLKHDHVVTIHQVGEDRGVPFLAMEFLEGEPLDARLQRAGKLPVPEVLRIGREVALALAAAHARGLIHRDVKPANIWLETPAGAPAGAGGRVKILDFGLARAAGEGGQLTQTGAIVGTPAYMAPEQAAGGPLDGRCDLFSLGCVLYRMATGRPAFQGSDLISTLLAVATSEPPPPRQLDATLPAALSDLVMALLAKEPGRRPPSAQAVAEALERLALRPRPRAAAKRTPAAKAAGRKWAVGAGVGAGALLAGLLLLWAAGVFGGKAPEDTTAPSTLPPGAEGAFARDNGFVPLFNGKDLSGWFVERGDPRSWTVADGEIIAWGQDGKTMNYLLTERAYADFRLRLEFNLSKGALSGVGLRALRGEKVPFSNGRPIDEHPVIKLVEHPDSVVMGMTHWVLNTMYGAPSQTAEVKPAGSWNRLELEVKGRSLRAWVNDKEVANATLAADSLLADGGLPGLNRSRGRIGLQKGAGTVRFRNVAIQELPAGPGAVAGAGRGAGKGFPVEIPEPMRGKWRMVDGCLELCGPGKFIRLFFGEKTWKDYDYSVEFLRVRGEDQLGLNFLRNDDNRQWMLFGPSFNRNRQHSLEWWGQGKPNHWFIQKPGSLPAGTWHRARVSIRAGHVQCFLNGQKVLEGRVDPRATGSMGLRSFWTVYRFRSIKVTDGAGRVLLEGLPDLDSAWAR
jgi:hypothetical protein